MKTVFQTSDKRNFYTPNNAVNHAKSLKDKAVKEVEVSEGKEDKISIPNLLALAANESLGGVKVMLKKEIDGEARKGAIDGLEKRIEELSND